MLAGMQKGTLLHCWWECKLVRTLWKTVWRSSKMKTELSNDPAIALLGIYPKDTNVVIWRGICTPMFIAAMSTMAKLWKEPRCPRTDKWIKKWCTHTHTHTHTHTLEHYSAIKKNEIMPFATTWMELEGIMLISKISQSEKDKYYMISLICGI